MHARTTLTLVLALSACKKTDDAAAAAAAQPLDRRARCEKIGEQMMQMGVLFARGMVSGLSEGKEKLADDEEVKLKAELQASTAELVEKCMTWPEETVGCFGTGAIFNSAECERLVAEAMGEAVPPADVPAGPSHAWTFALEAEQSILHGCEDGSVIVVVEPERSEEPPEGAPVATMLAIDGGKERWRKPLQTTPWSIEPLDATSVLVVLPREVVALAIADGKERWRAALPADDYDPSPQAILREGTTFTLLDSQRRIVEIDTTRCAKAGCAKVVATLPTDDPETHLGIELFGGVSLVRMDGGLAIVMPDEQRIAVLDADRKLRFAVESRAALSWAELRGTELVVAMDGEVIGLDPSKCGNAADTFAPSTWPPTGNPEWLRDATVREREWDATPPDCVRWRRPLVVSDSADAPIAGIADAMVVQAGGFLFSLTPTAEQWKSAVAAQSLAVLHGDRIAVLGDVGRDDTELAIMWLDPKTGGHLARSPIAMAKGEMFLMDGPELVGAGPLVVAGYERELVAFAR